MSFLLLMCLMLSPTGMQALPPTRNHKIFDSNKKTLSGFVSIIESAESLLHDNDGDPVRKIQRLMEGVSKLVKVGIKESHMGADGQIKIAIAVDGFRGEIDLLVKNYKKRGDDEFDPEQQKMVEGLTTVLYNVMYILINPDSVGSGLIKILSGVYKIISAVLADGRVDKKDWGRLLKALASVFKLSNLDISQIDKDTTKQLV